MARSRSVSDPLSELFQRAREPIFILNPERRIRFVNAAFEQLARSSSDNLIGLQCTSRTNAEPLSRALCPPAEVLQGNEARVRRTAPPNRVGPPWWEITFLPLTFDADSSGVLGIVRVIAAAQKKPSRSLPESLLSLRGSLRDRFALSLFESDSPAHAHVPAQIQLAMHHDSPTMIVGEDGAGKRAAARLIHHHGVTSERAWLEIDASALPAWCIEHQLGLSASGHFGAVCIREPGALPKDLQVRLLDLLAEPTRRLRWLATCTSVGRGSMSEQLSSALSVQVIHLAPLRTRLDDLPRLVQVFLERAAKQGLKPPSAIAEETMRVMRDYQWPGNLRELDTVVCVAAADANGGQLNPEHLPANMLTEVSQTASPAPPPRDAPMPPLDQLLEDVERRAILLALRKANGNKTEAAQMLGVWRPRLIRRIEALKLESTETTTDQDDDDAVSPGGRV